MTAAAHLEDGSREYGIADPVGNEPFRDGESRRSLTLLVVDPTSSVAERIVRDFRRHAIETLVCQDGAEALITLGRFHVDAVLAAATLPLVSGPQFVEALRRHRPHLPILIGASAADADDAIATLAAGATACVVRPYRLPEVIPLLRATFPDASIDESRTVLRVGPLSLDIAMHEVRFHDKPIVLPPREFDLLHYLMANVDRVVTPAQIRDNVWGLGEHKSSNTVVVHMRRIRKRLGDDPRNPQLIQTIRGLGYRLVLPD